MRIAIVQTPGTPLESWQNTLASLDALLADANTHRPDIVVLPECFWPAYDFGGPDAFAAQRAAGMPSSAEFVERLCVAAKRFRFGICAGYVEERDGRLYNAAGLIGSDGTLLGVHRKVFFWDFDHDYFAPGDTLTPIDTPWGRTGVLICADARLPENAATLVARGAQLILQPTCWVNVGTAEHPSNPQPEFIIPARATEFDVPFASASKWGGERDSRYAGSSLICDGAGFVLARCGARETRIVSADVELVSSRLPRMAAPERSVLLSDKPAATPAADAAPLVVLLGAQCSDREESSERLRKVVGEYGRQPTVGLCAPRLGASPELANVQEDAHLCLRAASDVLFSVGGVMVAAIRDVDAVGFATARRAALQGAHVIFVLGDAVAESLIRTRACENRVFVVWIRAEGAKLIDPRGAVCHERLWPTPTTGLAAFEIPVREACNKEVTARTDIHRGRRPALYEF